MWKNVFNYFILQLESELAFPVSKRRAIATRRPFVKSE